VEEALVALGRQLADGQVAARSHARDDLHDVGVDHRAPERPRDRDAVMTVADEVHLADAVDADRRHRLPAAHRVGDALPARADVDRRRAELAVEARRAVHRSVDRVQRDRLQPDVALLDAPERGDDLLEGQDRVDVAGAASQPPAERRHDLPATRALEVVLRVLGRKAGVEPGHSRRHTRRRGRLPVTPAGRRPPTRRFGQTVLPMSNQPACAGLVTSRAAASEDEEE